VEYVEVVKNFSVMAAYCDLWGVCAVLYFYMVIPVPCYAGCQSCFVTCQQ